MTTAIVVDSAAALPRELVDRFGIVVVPMTLISDGQSRPDTDVSTDELLDRLEHGEITTSGPSPGEWTAALTEAHEHADDVVVLTVSSEMSSTYTTAGLAATMVSDRVRVVDSRSAAGGEGLIALEAARLAAQGLDGERIADELGPVIERVHLVATLDNLDHLARSGRVPNIANAAAHTLRVNPLFEFHDGSARALHPALGHHAAEHRIVHSCLASRPKGASAPVLHAAVLEAAAPDRAQSLRSALLAEVPDADAFIGSFGPVMLVHVGPGLVGLAWWWEE